jgi:hypothetical protein
MSIFIAPDVVLSCNAYSANSDMNPPDQSLSAGVYVVNVRSRTVLMRLPPVNKPDGYNFCYQMAVNTASIGTDKVEIALGFQTDGTAASSPVVLYELSEDFTRMNRTQIISAPVVDTCFFGTALAWHGDLLLVGDPDLDPVCAGPGRVHVYQRTAPGARFGLWQKMYGDPAACVVGASVAFDGHTASFPCYPPSQMLGTRASLVSRYNATLRALQWERPVPS